jgi:hypothetical protein
MAHGTPNGHIGTEWCDGLPLRSTRPITPKERRQLQRERILGLVIGWPVLLSFPVVLFVALAALALAEPSSGGSIPPAFAVLMLAVLVLLGWLAMVGLDARRGAARVKLDLKVGSVKDFSLPESSIQSECYETATATTHFEILAGSGRIWSKNGQRVGGTDIRTVTLVAGVPAFAGIASQWLEPAGNVAGSPLDVGSRELSTAERAELRAHAAATWRRPLLWTVPLSLWYWPLQIFIVLSGRGLEGFWSKLHFAWLAWITIGADVAYVYAVRRAIALNRDAREGRVMIGRIRDVYPEGDRVSDFEFELLPVSRIYWTEQQRPADWRTHAR